MALLVEDVMKSKICLGCSAQFWTVLVRPMPLWDPDGNLWRKNAGTFWSHRFASTGVGTRSRLGSPVQFWEYVFGLFMGRFWVDVGSILVPIWSQKQTQNQSRALGAT